MLVCAWSGHKRALLCALATAVLYAVLAATVTGPQDTPLFLGGYLLAWLFYLLLLRGGRPLPMFFVLGCSLGARLLWVRSEPWLSDDLYRYLLDGRVLLEGVNPFRYPPEHSLIRSLSPEFAPLVNHPHVPTIYPTVIQLVGLGAALLQLGIVGWRTLLSFVDLILVCAVASLFGGGRRGWRAAAVYGLCPLAVIECGANGHVEPFALLPLVLAIRTDRWRPRGLLVGVAALAKYFPLVLLPLWLSAKRGWSFAALAAATVVLGMLPFAWAGVDVTVGLRTYLESWSFNGPVYALLHQFVGEAPWLRALPFFAVGVAGWLVGRKKLPPRGAAAPLLGLFLVCGPTIHPWYALWLLPFLGPRPNGVLWAFVFAMGLSYAVWWQQHTVGAWVLPLWQSVILWSVVAAAGLLPRTWRAFRR